MVTYSDSSPVPNGANRGQPKREHLTHPIVQARLIGNRHFRRLLDAIFITVGLRRAQAGTAPVKPPAASTPDDCCWCPGGAAVQSAAAWKEISASNHSLFIPLDKPSFIHREIRRDPLGTSRGQHLLIWLLPWTKTELHPGNA